MAVSLRSLFHNNSVCFLGLKVHTKFVTQLHSKNRKPCSVYTAKIMGMQLIVLVRVTCRLAHHTSCQISIAQCCMIHVILSLLTSAAQCVSDWFNKCSFSLQLCTQVGPQQDMIWIVRHNHQLQQNS